MNDALYASLMQGHSSTSSAPRPPLQWAMRSPIITRYDFHERVLNLYVFLSEWEKGRRLSKTWMDSDLMVCSDGSSQKKSGGTIVGRSSGIDVKVLTCSRLKGNWP